MNHSMNEVVEATLSDAQLEAFLEDLLRLVPEASARVQTADGRSEVEAAALSVLVRSQALQRARVDYHLDGQSVSDTLVREPGHWTLVRYSEPC